MARLEKILSKVLEVKENEIKDDSSPDNIENWDSFNGLMIAAELEKASGVTFTMEDVLSVKNVGDIKKALDKYHVRYEC